MHASFIVSLSQIIFIIYRRRHCRRRRCYNNLSWQLSSSSPKAKKNKSHFYLFECKKILKLTKSVPPSFSLCLFFQQRKKTTNNLTPFCHIYFIFCGYLSLFFSHPLSTRQRKEWSEAVSHRLLIICVFSSSFLLLVLGWRMCPQ